MTKRTKKIIVNSLTISRIIGALFLPVIFANLSVPALITLLAVLFSTDALDGKLSRKWEVQTIGGRMLDPLGDKLLAISCMISLISTHNFLLAPLFLELAIMGLNVYRGSQNDKLAVTTIGKIKTCFLSITLVLGAINLFNPELLNQLVELFGISTDRLTISETVVAISTAQTVAAQTLTIGSYTKEAVKNKDKKNVKIEELKSLREMLVRLFDEEKFEEDKDKPLAEIMKK